MSELTPAAGASIRITTVPNLRDLGGWRTPNGTVRRGRVYRSAEFSDLASPDAETFADLGIRTVFDMRTQDERTQQPNIVPDGTAYVVVDIFADRTGAAPAQLLAVLSDPAAAAALLGGGKAVTLFERAYRELITLPSAVNGYREFFTDLAEPSMVPAVFHCTTGKDRTGWGAASLLLLLGVSSGDVMEDYLLTNEQLLPSLQPILDRFVAAGGDPALLMPVLGVQRAYLDAAMDEMTRTYGDVETYFVDGLGVDPETIATLRSSLVTPAS
jgi:protein-tyrosine phosphatase